MQSASMWIAGVEVNDCGLDAGCQCRPVFPLAGRQVTVGWVRERSRTGELRGPERDSLVVVWRSRGGFGVSRGWLMVGLWFCCPQLKLTCPLTWAFLPPAGWTKTRWHWRSQLRDCGEINFDLHWGHDVRVLYVISSTCFPFYILLLSKSNVLGV